MSLRLHFSKLFLHTFFVMMTNTRSCWSDHADTWVGADLRESCVGTDLMMQLSLSDTWFTSSSPLQTHKIWVSIYARVFASNYFSLILTHKKWWQLVVVIRGSHVISLINRTLSWNEILEWVNLCAMMRNIKAAEETTLLLESSRLTNCKSMICNLVSRVYQLLWCSCYDTVLQISFAIRSVHQITELIT